LILLIEFSAATTLIILIWLVSVSQDYPDFSILKPLYALPPKKAVIHTAAFAKIKRKPRQESSRGFNMVNNVPLPQMAARNIMRVFLGECLSMGRLDKVNVPPLPN
jgi:hypothetical protein